MLTTRYGNEIGVSVCANCARTNWSLLYGSGAFFDSCPSFPLGFPDGAPRLILSPSPQQ